MEQKRLSWRTKTVAKMKDPIEKDGWIHFNISEFGTRRDVDIHLFIHSPKFTGYSKPRKFRMPAAQFVDEFLKNCLKVESELQDKTTEPPQEEQAAF